MVFYCFIIKKEGGAFKATGTNDKSKALEGVRWACVTCLLLHHPCTVCSHTHNVVTVRAHTKFVMLHLSIHSLNALSPYVPSRTYYVQIEGADYKSIVKSIRTTCKATDPANGIKVGGGPTGKNTYVVSVTTGPAMSFSGGGGGGGGAAPAAKGAYMTDSLMLRGALSHCSSSFASMHCLVAIQGLFLTTLHSPL